MCDNTPDGRLITTDTGISVMTEQNDIPCGSKAPACRPPKRSEFITIRVSLAIKDQLTALANQKERPLSWLVNGILERFLNDVPTTEQRE